MIASEARLRFPVTRQKSPLEREKTAVEKELGIRQAQGIPCGIETVAVRVVVSTDPGGKTVVPTV
jgi:hypothetical protein